MPIHPEMASKFPLLDGIDSFTALLTDPANGERAARFFRPTVGGPPPLAETREQTVPGPHGPVPIRIYFPADVADRRNCLIWMHGGAFRMGDLDMPEADWVARDLVARAGLVVVSVDYRLCVGGVSYPVPHDDVVAAARWTRDNADELGVDRDRISIGGASAGGTLATGATLRLRDDDGWQPANVVLAYPVLHPQVPPLSATDSRRMEELPPILKYPVEEMLEITENYLGGPLSRADGYAMPALAALEGLTRTLIMTAEYDDLAPSGREFAAQLAVAGVDVRHVGIASMLHGFLNLPAAVEPVNRALDLISETVRS
ncbi:alpha/beta hydrolase [Kribbella sp. NPDC056861]|uniref:alpha/beta hydrolase n=1 Tax=Kribbella sp. NPDC056861 TaxID=3154857 RepID=UPI003427271C